MHNNRIWKWKHNKNAFQFSVYKITPPTNSTSSLSTLLSFSLFENTISSLNIRILFFFYFEHFLVLYTKSVSFYRAESCLHSNNCWHLTGRYVCLTYIGCMTQANILWETKKSRKKCRILSFIWALCWRHGKRNRERAAKNGLSFLFFVITFNWNRTGITYSRSFSENCVGVQTYQLPADVMSKP